MYFRYIINIAGQSSLVARRAHNPKVVGSNPSPATNKWSRSVVVNMSACHAEDHGFKSRRDRHFFGPVAQSVEQETENLCVGSSILPWTTFNKNTRCQGHLFLFFKSNLKGLRNMRRPLYKIFIILASTQEHHC